MLRPLLTFCKALELLLLKKWKEPQNAQWLSALITCNRQRKVTREALRFLLNRRHQSISLAFEHELTRVVNDADDRSTAHPLQRLPTMSLEQSVDRNLGVFQETVEGFLIRLAVHLLRKTLARV